MSDVRESSSWDGYVCLGRWEFVVISNKLNGKKYRFESSRRICFEKMLVRMTVWSSKKVFLSRKEISSKNESSGVCDVSRCWRFVILSYATFRAWNVRELEDISRCCKDLVLAMRLKNILVWLRMFAAKILVHVWMLIILFAIEELWLRCRVNFSMGTSFFLHSALWSVGLPRCISCIF